MKDRTLAGAIGGLAAGLAMNVPDYVGYYSGFHRERLLDWGAVVTLGRLPATVAETIFAQVVQLAFAGVLGIFSLS